MGSMEIDGFLVSFHESHGITGEVVVGAHRATVEVKAQVEDVTTRVAKVNAAGSYCELS